jgi:hypothetical protein
LNGIFWIFLPIKSDFHIIKQSGLPSNEIIEMRKSLKGTDLTRTDGHDRNLLQRHKNPGIVLYATTVIINPDQTKQFKIEQPLLHGDEYYEPSS